ncbi:hypothetical protein B0T10DRAFT_501276 [Thelonectria olida]|uniref:Short-chain dehydrogenase/reductase 3 n=1 Tax=Thelonectria olida TaxID=1576542 RepID=A0A9P9AIE0_9HYPO|nr:hypothetical protein B0T10DRAFT_501276 [Thelonectria olida]
MIRFLSQLALLGSASVFISYDPASLESHYGALEWARSRIQFSTLKTGLLVLIGLKFARTLSSFFNAVALNNWRLPATKDWDWPSEIAVVTGGCNGIGKAVVVGLAQKGLKVAVLDMSDLPEDLAGLDNVSYWKCDITSQTAVSETADGIRRSLGHPSILVNNAGIAHEHTVLETTHEELERIFSVNIISHWLTTKEFLPEMISKNKGHLVTVTSMSSYVPLPKSVDYSATKAGLLAFHLGLSSEIKHVYKAPGIMSSIVHPMWVETKMTKKRAARSEKARQAMMQPQDVAQKILDQIFSCCGGQILLPSNGTWLTAIHGFPNWFQELIRDLAAKRR